MDLRVTEGSVEIVEVGRTASVFSSSYARYTLVCRCGQRFVCGHQAMSPRLRRVLAAVARWVRD